MDDLIEALLNPKVTAILAKSLEPAIAVMLQRHLAPIQLAIKEIKEEYGRLESERASLAQKVSAVVAENSIRTTRLEELER